MSEDLLVKILNVDPENKQDMDDIDYMFLVFLDGIEYERCEGTSTNAYFDNKFDDFRVLVPRVSRSRNELKRLRPENWRMNDIKHLENGDVSVEMFNTKGNPFNSYSYAIGQGKTEELAELYAIIEAYIIIRDDSIIQQTENK